jgi:predicted nucleic acid-binding Zn ribbon protein
MRSIQTFAGGVLADVIRRQPPSAARTSFAWQLAVGPALARVTSVEMEGVTLRVRSADPRWLKEIERAKPLILQKLQQLLGAEAVREISVKQPDRKSGAQDMK